MWYRSYRNHVIMAFPSFDTVTRSWAPQANITWVIGAARESAFVRFPMRVMSEGEAVASALAAAKRWIDQRKSESRDRWDGVPDFKTPVRDSIDSLLKENVRPRRIRLAPSKNAGKTLTFDDFKANLASLGTNASERSLLKSYDALIKLRKTSHCSWAQIKSILKRSQANSAIRQRRNRQTRSPGLPLTPHAWRRVF